MIKRRTAFVLFYNKNKILLQERGDYSKYGEEYAFFGGGIEEGETPEEALIREIKEELGIEIKNFKLFKKDIIDIKEIGGKIERNFFISSLIDVNNIKVKEGKLALMDFKEGFNLKMIEGDVELIREVYDSLK